MTGTAALSGRTPDDIEQHIQYHGKTGAQPAVIGLDQQVEQGVHRCGNGKESEDAGVKQLPLLF